MPSDQYEVRIRLIRNNEPFHAGLKIGDEWEYNYTPPAGMYGFAFNAIFPFAITMVTGGTFPWQQNPNVLTIACPDPEVHNVF